MRLQTSLNGWSCIATAFAMALDMQLETLVDLIGHDGGEIMNEQIPEPGCRRGFHIQEIIPIAIEKGFAVTPIEVLPQSSPDGVHVWDIDFRIPVRERFWKLLKNNEGVLTGRTYKWNHAIAWDGSKFYDPRGAISVMPSVDFNIETFWMINKIKSS